MILFNLKKEKREEDKKKEKQEKIWINSIVKSFSYILLWECFIWV